MSGLLLTYGAMVAQQILVLLIEVRVLIGQREMENLWRSEDTANLIGVITY